jgi:hypothetical protein
MLPVKKYDQQSFPSLKSFRATLDAYGAHFTHKQIALVLFVY